MGTTTSKSDPKKPQDKSPAQKIETQKNVPVQKPTGAPEQKGTVASPTDKAPIIQPTPIQDTFRFHTVDQTSENSEEQEFKFFSEPLEISSDTFSSILSVEGDSIFFKPAPIQQVNQEDLNVILHKEKEQPIDRKLYENFITQPLRVQFHTPIPVHNVFDDFDKTNEEIFNGPKKIVIGKKPTLFEDDIKEKSSKDTVAINRVRENHYESNKFDLVKDVFIIKHNL